jgi:hydrogenase maturation factor HypF (carbamoyltransferase family)
MQSAGATMSGRNIFQALRAKSIWVTEKAAVACGLLFHSREILCPVDDSVEVKSNELHLHH